MEAVIERIGDRGGIVRHIFPTHVLIAELNDAAAQQVSKDRRVDLVTGDYADPDAIPAEYGRMAHDAVAAWNQLLAVPLLAPEDELGPEDFPRMPLVDDAFEAPDEGLGMRGSVSGAPAPPGAAYWQTSEYLMGSAIVSIVFVESNGAIDTQTENWISGEESNVVAECLAGANWWISQYPYSVSPLSFTWVYNYARQTGYEPINRSSSDDGLWLAEVLTGLGYSCNSSTYFGAARNYANDLRNNNNKDWGYSVFVVDSSVDADGTFTDSYFAYAYLGGPFMIMTYDNDGWGIGNMDKVFAHESGHIFRAGDEYCQPGYSCCSSSSYYGYLRIQNTNCNTGVNCMMNTNAWAVCSVSQQQIGWRDTDADTIPDILDVAPTASLTAYTPDPTNDDTPTYTGSASVGFYPNQLSPGYNVTVNRIAGAQYRVDGGSWQACTASDGTFDSGTEAFTFTTATLSGGSHTFEVRATDTAGNVTQPAYSSDGLTITSHSVTVTAGASPTTVGSGGTSTLSASFSDSSGHGIATWSWTDNGGGSFSPSASVQNPTYNAPANLSDADVIILLTVTGTCDGPSPLSDSDSVSVTVQPVAHTFQVIANSPAPTPVGSGGATSLSGTYSDSRSGHSVASWSWGDGGAGGSFLPSAAVQSPGYTAPANLGDANVAVVLTVTATCNGPAPLSDSDSTTLVVQPVPHIFQVTANPPSPATVASSGATSLSASYADSRPAHSATSWAWNDAGAGGSFSPSDSVQNPGYTAPPNVSGSDNVVTLTVSATCTGPSPLSDSDSTNLIVQPVPHAVTVTAGPPSPATILSGCITALSATFSDSRGGHSAAIWSWTDNGGGGSFSPSASVQNPTYRAGPNAGSTNLIVTLTVTGTCSGPSPLSDSDSVQVAVLPAGTQTIGLYSPAAGEFSLRNANTAGPADVTFRFGPSPCSWKPFAGDWDGNGADSVGFYDPAASEFRLRNSNTPGVSDLKFKFGPAPCSWLPIAGDWDGNGTRTAGLYDPATGTFRLINHNSVAATADLKFVFSSTSSNWLPIAGDWNGDGIVTVGLYDPTTGYFHLRNANSAGPADLSFRFGPAPCSWLPIAGDWNADGTDTVGLYDATTGTYRLINHNSIAANADLKFVFGPAPSTWKPIAGDWDGI
jgi:hypothetical protein